MAKQGIKKSISPADKVMWEAKSSVNKWNQLYCDKDENNKLVLMTKMERRMEAAKVMAFAEQYCIDVICLALHNQLGYGGERLSAIVEAFTKEYKARSDMEQEDRAVDSDAWYSSEVFERNLADACGKYYVPPEERYRTQISGDGYGTEETTVDMFKEVMSLLRSDGEFVKAS